jgi:hypothetical protein
MISSVKDNSSVIVQKVFLLGVFLALALVVIG